MAQRIERLSWLRRRVSRRTGLRAGSAAVAGSAAWLIACGGGEDDGGEAGDQGASGTPGVRNQVTAPTGQPKRGGTMSYRISGTPPLDPHANTTFRAQVQAGHTYSRMLKFKAGTDPAVSYNYEVEPDLAAGHELSSDGLQLTFKIQPNATFHNKPPVNGHAVTGEDVRVSLERFRTLPQNSNRAAFGSQQNPIVQSVETPDDKTVVIKLAKPYAPILNLFANPQYLWILPREVAGGFDPARDQIGSGPWMLTSVQPDIAVEHGRNPTWFVPDRPHMDGVRDVIIAEVAQEIAQFQAEKLDWAGVPAEQKADVEKTNARASWIGYTPTTYTFISPQQRSGPFRDERVRRALSLAIDRKAWGDLLYLSQGVKMLNFLPASMGKWWLDPQGKDAGPSGEYTKYNAGEAKKLLQAAGYENQQFRFIFANNAYGERFNQGAEATAGMLNEAGLRAQIVTQDYLREYIGANQTFFGAYEGVFYGLQTPFTDPHDYLFNMNSSASQRNHAGINDPQLEQMLQSEETTLNEAERVKKVHDIQRYLMEKMYYVPVAVGNAYIAVQPWLKNFQYSSTYGYPTESFPHMWLDRG
jgi:peptide/nickel transport system substrate-binding protein